MQTGAVTLWLPMNQLQSVVGLVGNAALLALFLFLILHYRIERNGLRTFVSQCTHGGPHDLGVLLTLAGIIHSHVQRANDPAFVPLPLFAELGATPLSVLLRGGCCSGLSRLYILSLNAMGIRAGQVTLYHASGRAQHCLVQVWLGDTPVLVDPTYGFYFVNARGELIGLRSLVDGETPRFVPLPMSVNDSYPSNDYYNFAFVHTKTANWTKSPLRRGAYRVLRWVTRERIDRMVQPSFLEWPQLMLASTTVTAIVAFNLLLAFW